MSCGWFCGLFLAAAIGWSEIDKVVGESYYSQPYAALLVFAGEQSCSGTIASRHAELTAATCYRQDHPWNTERGSFAHAGNEKYSGRADYFPPSQSVKLDDCVMADESSRSKFDIMVCTHTDAWTFTDFVNSAALDLESSKLAEDDGIKCLVVGFKSQKNVLQRTWHEVRSWRSCLQVGSEQSACSTSADQETCHLLPGSSVMCRRHRKRPALLALLSKPVECSSTGWNMLSYLGHYRDWIVKNVPNGTLEELSMGMEQRLMTFEDVTTEPELVTPPWPPPPPPPRPIQPPRSLHPPFRGLPPKVVKRPPPGVKRSPSRNWYTRRVWRRKSGAARLHCQGYLFIGIYTIYSSLFFY